MTTIREHADDYLNIRHAMGFHLVGEARILRLFVDYADRHDVEVVTTERAVAFTNACATQHPDTLARRMRVVRKFAEYLRTLDDRTQVPPTELFPSANNRPTPHIFSDAEIAALLHAARLLQPACRAATTHTVIGLLAATGMRVSEAMHLDNDDIDWSAGVLTVRNTKFDKSRLVPIHATTLTALRDYNETIAELRQQTQASTFFLSVRATPLTHSSIQPTFRQVRTLAGLTGCSPRPRLHDLRHTFTVNTLLRWYRDGDDVAARLPALSTYLGHVDPAATYWYLSAVPELLACAAQRLEPCLGERS